LEVEGWKLKVRGGLSTFNLQLSVNAHANRGNTAVRFPLTQKHQLSTETENNL
jgi:hypothetical protein